MLCGICDRVVQQRASQIDIAAPHQDWEWKDLEHHSSQESFFQSVEKRCYVCCCLWTSSGFTWPPDLAHQVLPGRYFPIRAWVWPKASRLRFMLQPGRMDTIEFVIWAESDNQAIPTARATQPGSPSTTQKIGHWRLSCLKRLPWRHFQANTQRQSDVQQQADFQQQADARDCLEHSDMVDLALPQACLQDCLSGHNCTSVGAKPRLPSRLVDLEPFKEALNGFWAVVESQKLPRDSRYTTLSHCWGGHIPVRLLHSNYESFHSGRPDSDLPLTFRHAAQVTRSLGYRYIWIDSLTIIQDSREDWAHESLTMYDVYQHSACTIAAQWGKNSDAGLFIPSMPLPGEIVLFTPEPCGENQEVKQAQNTNLKGEKRRICVNKSRTLILRRERSILQSRAWAFQELMVSPRILSFNGDQVSWHCKEIQFWPSYGTQKSDFARAFTPLHGSISRTKPPLGQHTDLYEAWNSVIQGYSTCYLTKAEDKLVALSGLAKAFYDLGLREYKAGLWTELLPRALLWSISDPATRSTAIEVGDKTQKVPSWTWASISDRAVTPMSGYHAIEQSTAKVFSISVTTSTGDPFGEAVGGQLELTASIKPFEPGDFDLSDGGKGPDGMKIRESGGALSMSLDNSATLGVAPISFVSCVSNSMSEKGLILQRVDGTDEDVYRRVGIFHIWDDNHMFFADKCLTRTIRIL